MTVPPITRVRRRTRIYDVVDTDNSSAVLSGIEQEVSDLGARVTPLETMSGPGFKGAVTAGPVGDLTPAQAIDLLPVTGVILTGFAVSGTRTAINAASSILSAFGKVQKWLNDLSAVAFSGSWSDLTGTPTTVAGAGLTDAVTTGTAQQITAAKAITAPLYTKAVALVTVTGSVTLAAADIAAGVLDFSGTSTSTLTFPNGAAVDGAFPGAANDTALLLSVINRGTATASLAGASGVTLIGALSVIAGASATWQIRRVAASTYEVRRIAG